MEAARKLLTDEQAPRRQRLLADLIHNLNENSLAEDREDDKKWFEGTSVARRELLRGSGAHAVRRSRSCQFYCSERKVVQKFGTPSGWCDLVPGPGISCHQHQQAVLRFSKRDAYLLSENG